MPRCEHHRGIRAAGRQRRTTCLAGYLATAATALQRTASCRWAQAGHMPGASAPPPARYRGAGRPRMRHSWATALSWRAAQIVVASVSDQAKLTTATTAGLKTLEPGGNHVPGCLAHQRSAAREVRGPSGSAAPFEVAGLAASRAPRRRRDTLARSRPGRSAARAGHANVRRHTSCRRAGARRPTLRQHRSKTSFRLAGTLNDRFMFKAWTDVFDWRRAVPPAGKARPPACTDFLAPGLLPARETTGDGHRKPPATWSCCRALSGLAVEVRCRWAGSSFPHRSSGPR
jgi:hypothetical protein